MTIDDILEAAEKAFPETMELSVTMEAKYLKMYEYVVARANLAPQLAAEVRRLREREKVLTEALERLARLGNGDFYGNSDGNMIARAALALGTKEPG